MHLRLAGIDLVSEDSEPYNIKTRGWLVYPYFVEGPEGITRDDLSRLVGCEVHGKIIKAVESVCIENQFGKTIGIAVDA